VTQDHQKKAQAKIMFRIIFNILLLVIEVVLILSITRSWFVDNTHVEAPDMEVYVTGGGLSLYINVSTNNQSPSPGHTADAFQINRYAIPGDILNFSVFMPLANTEYSKIDITAYGLEYWLQYFTEEPATVQYAQGTEMIGFEYMMAVDLLTLPCNAKVINVERSEGDLTFTIELPPDFYVHGDAICLNFSLYFHDDDGNQNDYMGQLVSIGFRGKGE